MAHIINLTVQTLLDDLDSSQKAISKLRKVITLIQSSPQRRERFQAQCTASNKRQKELILDVKTRWNSTYSMIETASEYSDPLDNTIATDRDMRTNELCDDWEILRMILNILQVSIIFCNYNTVHTYLLIILNFRFLMKLQT